MICFYLFKLLPIIPFIICALNSINGLLFHLTILYGPGPTCAGWDSAGPRALLPDALNCSQVSRCARSLPPVCLFLLYWRLL